MKSWLIALFILIIIGTIIFISCKIIKAKKPHSTKKSPAPKQPVPQPKSQKEIYEDFVKANSKRIKQLNEINSRYDFCYYNNFDQHYTYDNANFFNNVTCEDFLLYQLQTVWEEVSSQIKRINYNRKQYPLYLEELNGVADLEQFEADFGELNSSKVYEYEKRIADTLVRPKPPTKFTIKVELYNSDLKGKLLDMKSDEFSAKDISLLIKKLNKKNGDYFCDKTVWDTLCKVERSMVSNKLRFAIYERDGRKCCCCGASQKSTRLEIDHIIPISRGGKSTPDNLQTLCHRCNYAKRDRAINCAASK